MAIKEMQSKALFALKKAPFLGINVMLVLVLCAGLAKPLANDWIDKHIVMINPSQKTTVSGFFDFGGFMSSLNGLISTFSGFLNTFIEAPVAALEKKAAALKEIEQAGLNYKAATQSNDAAIGAVDLVIADTPEACTIKRETMETVAAANETGLIARARTQFTARRSMYTPSSLGASKELLNASFNEYCSPESFSRGNCKNGISPKSMPDADINANAIMGSSDGLSNKMSKDELDAASKYVDWVSDPVPYENPPLALLNTPAGQRIAVEMRRRAAISSAAQFALNKIIAARSEKK